MRGNPKPLVKEVLIDAAVSKVWEAITDKAAMKQWYFDLTAFKPEIGFEFQCEGGKDDKPYLHICKITEVIPNKKLCYSWRYDGYPGSSHVTFELFEEGDKTRQYSPYFPWCRTGRPHILQELAFPNGVHRLPKTSMIVSSQLVITSQSFEWLPLPK